MSTYEEKQLPVEVEEHQNSKPAVTQTKTIIGNAAFEEALLQEPPSPRSRRQIILYFCCIVGFFCSTMNGYDGSLFNSLTENTDFLDYYHGSNKGTWQAIVSAMYQIGSVSALPFVGPVIDGLGRRWGMAIGSLFVVVGTILQGTSAFHASIGQFEGGRFMVGFGVSIASSAGPMYVIEVSHPAYRGIMTAFYNTWWFTGSILCSGAARGADNLSGHISWKIPIWIQLCFSSMVVLAFLFLPESPRWLYVHGRREEATAMLVKYHGEGNPDSVWVSLQLNEYEEHLDLDGSDKRWWDYRALFRNKAAIYRIGCNCCVAGFGQLAGNSVLSYFQSAAFETAGLVGTIPQANATLGNACQQFFFAMLGATLVDRVGRRPLLLFSNIACSIVWVCMCISASIFAGNSNNAAAGDATLAFIFIFGTVYSIGFTPLQALYPVEVLSFEIRAKGMAFSSVVMNIVSIFNNYTWPIALEEIGWKVYIVFAIWCAIQAGIIYVFIPETKNRTLEELDEIFNAPSPVKYSLQKKTLGLTNSGEVVTVEKA